MEKVSTAGHLVLGLIDRLGEATPYDVKQAAQHTNAFFALPHTQIYVQCTRLVSVGYLDEQQEEHGRRRRLLTVTPEGQEALREWADSGVDTQVEARDVALLKLYFEADPQRLARQQLTAHEELLARYEEIAGQAEGLDPGPRRTLRFGLAFERMQVDFWSGLIADA